MALDLAEDARARLAEWRVRALAGRSELRPVAVEALHVTLVFVGPRPETQMAEIARTAVAASGGSPALELAPGALIDVPRGRPRLVALGLGDPVGAAAALHEAVAGALEAAGLYEPETRPFWPHVTLARLPRQRGRGGEAERSRARSRRSTTGAPAPPASLRFDRVTLYRSHLRPRGARYEPIESRALPARRR